ncbi:MAG: isochorismate synthase [Bacillota bacterium]|nr:isochorismate synthase [Bacillota bacterium]
MVTIQETEIEEKGKLAIQRAKKIGKPILTSIVHKINTIDPLLFFQTGSKRYLGERFFWKDPSDETILVGIGIVKQIQSDQASDRFFHVENEWKKFISDSIIENPFTENGLGPIMFGGFSFDPFKEKTDLWSQYSDSDFHVPKFMLSIIRGQAFFTTNIVCTQYDDVSLFNKVMDERNHFLNSLTKELPLHSFNLVETKEIFPERWKETVDEVVDTLISGQMKKVVLARELRLVFNHLVCATTVLSRLFKEQKESFIFAFESGSDCFIGASPERLVKKKGNDVFSTCLAGSISRGKSPSEDQVLGDTLLKDQKNLREHQFVVEMIKEAMEESCEEVLLPDHPQLMKMRDIQHLYTPVIGKSKPNTSLLLFVERLHPTPALGGLPKKEAIEKIRQVEELDRGFYAAPLGWMDYKESGEFAVSIRSALIQGKEASLFAGCGVVADSDSESEYQETGLKFRPMLSALGGK